MIDSPRIYLAIDNCFASRRWTAPQDWATVIGDLGLQYVEASADNECDPLYTTPDYLADWVTDVERVRERTGVTVVNLYSGHGTYATTGLTHADQRIRDHILQEWLVVMAGVAGELDAGLGFACHAFSEPVMQDPAVYGEAKSDLFARLSALARHAQASGTRSVGIEQMYTPHMIPWTLEGSAELLRQVYREAGHPFYLTIDTGHACAQRRFLRPGREQLRRLLQDRRVGRNLSGLCLGPQTAYDLFRQALDAPPAEASPWLDRIEEEMDRHPYFFAHQEDGEIYLWLERLGCYSPIVHLQQTTGHSSAHLPFTAECNQNGIIHPQPLLRALNRAYAREPESAMPPRCDQIYLTIEVFTATADLPVDIIARLQETVAYWRRWIPQDGLTLSQLLAQSDAR
jgi:hypothetical protein